VQITNIILIRSQSLLYPGQTAQLLPFLKNVAYHFDSILKTILDYNAPFQLTQASVRITVA